MYKYIKTIVIEFTYFKSINRKKDENFLIISVFLWSLDDHCIPAFKSITRKFVWNEFYLLHLRCITGNSAQIEPNCKNWEYTQNENLHCIKTMYHNHDIYLKNINKYLFFKYVSAKRWIQCFICWLLLLKLAIYTQKINEAFTEVVCDNQLAKVKRRTFIKHTKLNFEKWNFFFYFVSLLSL